MALKRDKGLYYYCKDKWVSDHRCQPRMHLLITDEDMDLTLPPIHFDTEIPVQPSSPPLPIKPNLQLSLYAMPEMSAPETFCVYDVICHHKFTILVDGDNTHNFAQTRVAKFLDLSSKPIEPLRVMVGNSEVMDCTHLHPQVLFSI